MKKIIHFSDIHIGHEDEIRINHKEEKQDMYERFRWVIKNTAMVKQPAENYVIVITGDIVDEASDENYRKAKECLDILTNQSYQVLIVPGNHDYSSIRSFADKKWVGKFKKQFFGTNQIDYPKLDIIDEIAFIGLDSMEGELGSIWERIGGGGELGRNQLNKLDAMLSSSEVESCKKKIVYLHHHPLNPIPEHELKDAKEFSEVLSKYHIDALLFGHLHHGKKWNGCIGYENIPRIYDAGTTTMKQGFPGPHRVLDLTRDAVFDYDGDFHGDYAILSRLSLIEALGELLGRL